MLIILFYQSTSLKISEMENIAKYSKQLDVKILLLSHLIIRSLLPKQYQLQGQFAEFVKELSNELDKKEFKCVIMAKAISRPVYKHEPMEDFSTATNASALSMNAYTGLFGVICAIAVLYSIKNR